MLPLPPVVRPLLAACLVLFASAALGAERLPYLAGYADADTYEAQIKSLSGIDGVRVTQIGESVGKRPLWVITVGRGDVDAKPAIAVVGSIEGEHLLGSELCVRMAEQLAKQAQEDPKLTALLDRCTFYFLPRPDPDGSAKAFASPAEAVRGNDRKTDDDRDFKQGEDPANDLNGDGLITQMRVEDEAGTHLPDADDPNLLVAVDRKKNERPKYRVLTEGRDDDGDQQFNEDGSSGVRMNRNFPHQYKPFQPNTGEHAASEPETRAILDFFFDHQNIALVFTFSAENNLYHAWKAGDPEKIRKTIYAADANALELVAADYKKLLDASDPPAAADAAGSFSQWAYFQFGRWSLTSRGWWPPKVTAKEGERKTDDKRSADEANLLRWLKVNEIDGFAAWQSVEHPDFPGKKVEIGGFKPFAGLNPPAAELDKLADKHLPMLTQLANYLPQLALVDSKAEALGGGVFRVSTTVLNRGYLPTMPEVGATSGQNFKLQIKIDLPEGAELLQGSARKQLARLEGSGGKVDHSWLVRFKNAPPAEVVVRVWAPAAGSADITIPLPTVEAAK